MKKESNFSVLMNYAGTMKYLTYASWLLSALSALFSLLPFYYIWKIIQELLQVAPNFNEAYNIVSYGWMAVIFSLLSYLLYSIGLLCSHFSAFRVASSIRNELTSHIVTLPLGFVDHFGSGKVRSIINDSSAASETYLAHQLPDLVSVLATTAGLLVMLLVFDFKLGLLSLIPIFLGFIFLKNMTGEESEKEMRHYNNALEDMSNEAVEYVRGIPVVKTFGQTVFSFKKFKDSIDNYSKWVKAYTLSFRLPMTLYTIAINSVFLFLIGAGIFFTRGSVSEDFLLNLIFYIIITPIISTTLAKIMFLTKNGMIVSDALKRIRSIMDLSPLHTNVSDESIQGSSVELDDISYSYDDKKNALDHISLKINPGETVAFVGASGSGKSTLANIIARFFDPQYGIVKIDGIDVRNIPKEELMNTVSFVFQNVKLIKASILDNILLAKPDASEEDVMQALEAAQCMDIINKLPDGIHSMIGSHGTYLSGGEMQRLAIARTMLKDSPIVILDEATAFTDPDNEIKVQQAFAKLSEDKTVILIAHRLSTIINVDNIFVLEQGHLIEQGTAEQLISKDGVFSKMWHEYQQSVNWKVRKDS